MRMWRGSLGAVVAINQILTNPLFVNTKSPVIIEFDPVKRDITLRERGLNFADATLIFEGPQIQLADMRFVYPEPRFQTFGLIAGRMVTIVWTPTEKGRRIISMRKANDREQKRYYQHLG